LPLQPNPTTGSLIVASVSQSMGRKPNKRGEGSNEMGRSEAIRIGVVHFQRYHCLPVSVCSVDT